MIRRRWVMPRFNVFGKLEMISEVMVEAEIAGDGMVLVDCDGFLCSFFVLELGSRVHIVSK